LIPSCPPLLFLWNKAGIEMADFKSLYISSSTIERERERERERELVDIKSMYICSERERQRERCALKIEYEHARTWGTDVSKPQQGIP
jgi:hypothetical protein